MAPMGIDGESRRIFTGGASLLALTLDQYRAHVEWTAGRDATHGGDRARTGSGAPHPPSDPEAFLGLLLSFRRRWSRKLGRGDIPLPGHIHPAARNFRGHGLTIRSKAGPAAIRRPRQDLRDICDFARCTSHRKFPTQDLQTRCGHENTAKTPGHTSQSSFGVTHPSVVCPIPVFSVHPSVCVCPGVLCGVLRVSRCSVIQIRGREAKLVNMWGEAMSLATTAREAWPQDGGRRGASPDAGEAWPRPYALFMSTPGSLKNKPSRGPSPPT